MNRLAEKIGRPEPTMAVVFGEPLNDEAISNIAVVADVAEFRADLYPSHEPNYLIEQVRRLGALPLLLTVRLKAEGGEWVDSEGERLQLISDVVPYVDGVDIELASDILPEVADIAHSKDKVLIVSSHDFKETPPLETLEYRLTDALIAGADYVKFATTANSEEEYRRLAGFTLDHQDSGLIVVAMGKYGPLSRIAFHALGSHLIYAFAGEDAVAPGQLGYLELHKLWKQLYPNYRNLFTHSRTS